VLGGLLSSTLLNLVVLPALAQRYVRVTRTNESAPYVPGSIQVIR
jgi:Cu/Ag efflux pump CusA